MSHEIARRLLAETIFGERRLAVSYFPHVQANRPQCRAVSWHTLKTALSQHPERANKNGPLWSPVAYPQGSTRARANVLKVSCLVADIDTGADTSTLERVRTMLSGFAHVIHSTYSHTPQSLKMRAVAPLGVDIGQEDWEDVWARWRATFAHLRVTLDSACKDPSRIYYLPAHPPGGEHFTYANDGPPFDLDFMPRVALEPAPVANPAKYAGNNNSTERLFLGAVKRAKREGDRNSIGNWLAWRMLQNGISHATAAAVLEQYAREVAGAGSHPYTLAEAEHTLKSVYGRSSSA